MNNLSKISIDDIQPGLTLGHADAALLRDELRELLAYREAGKEPALWWTGPSPTWTGEIESTHDHETGSHPVPLYAGPQLPAVHDEAEQRLAAAVELLKLAAPHMLSDESLKDPGGAMCGKRPSIHDGWALVPIEATPEMLNASWIHHGIHAPSAWRAMLAAAPNHTEDNLEKVNSPVIPDGSKRIRLPELFEDDRHAVTLAIRSAGYEVEMD